jgi:hypothetical protein
VFVIPMTIPARGYAAPVRSSRHTRDICQGLVRAWHRCQRVPGVECD